LDHHGRTQQGRAQRKIALFGLPKERSMRERITSLSVTVAIRSGAPGTLQAANQGEASAGQGQVSLGNSRWRGVH